MNKEIETLEIRKDIETIEMRANNDNKIIIIVIIAIIIICIFLFTLMELEQKKEEATEPLINDKDLEENNEEEIIEEKEISRDNILYICSKGKYDKDTYTTELIYEFRMQDNKLSDGHIKEKYIFKSKGTYTNFQVDNTVSSHILENDDNNLTKILIYSICIPQQSNGTNALEEYLKMLENDGWKCEKD